MGKKKKITIIKLIVLLVLFVSFIGCSKEKNVSNSSIMTLNKERRISYQLTD